MPTRARNLLRAGALASLLAIAPALAQPPAAVAAPYTLTACGATGKVGGWRATSTSEEHLQAGSECPPSAGPADPNSAAWRTGLFVTDGLAPATDTSQGTIAGWEFRAPAGATITRAQFWRAMRKQDDNGFRMFFRFGALNSAAPEQDDCTIPVGYNACGSGAWGYAAPGRETSQSYTDHSGLSTSALSFGVRCDEAWRYACMNGFTIQHVRVLVYEARVTIDDPTAPSSAIASGDAWTTDRWVDNSVDVAVAGEDPQSGVRATRVYVDGELVSTIERKDDEDLCDWSMPTPCAQINAGQPTTHTIDTTQLEDGEHELAVATVNAAGAETRTTRTTALLIDNHAPGPVENLAATRRGDTNVFDVSWSLPVDRGSPLIDAEYQLCTTTCGPFQQTDSLTGVDGIELPARADASLRVRLLDAAGRSPSELATVTLPYLAPPPVDPPVRPPVDPPVRPPVAPPVRPPAPPVDPPEPPVDPPAPPVPPVDPPAPPRPPEPPAGEGNETGRSSARLRVSRPRRSRLTIRVRGSIARTARGRVTVTFTTRRGRRTARVTARAAIRRGRWSALVRLPAALRSARGTLTVAWSGNAHTRPARSTRRVGKVPR